MIGYAKKIEKIIRESAFDKKKRNLGPVVRRPISVNPGLNFNLGSSLFCLKEFSWINFSIVFGASSR